LEIRVEGSDCGKAATFVQRRTFGADAALLSPNHHRNGQVFGMNSAPLVSVIIIFFNEARFLREAIESVLNQNYNQWELLLIDDGSADDSTAIALAYAARHPGKVVYLEHKDHQNRGACASRNLGIRHSRADYIAFLDADDVWLPRKLKEQLAILRAQPEAGMVYGATRYWHSWTGNPEDIGRDYVPDLGIQSDTLVKPPTLLTRYLESKALTPCPSDILLRREVLERVGGFEEKFSGVRQLYEDQAFLAKVYLTTPVFVASSCWDRYRLHPDSCVSRVERANLKYNVGLFYLKWLEKYLAKEGIKNPEIQMALRDKRRRYRLANLQCRHETLFRLWRGACNVLRHMQPESRKQW
jgi:glycosyltransferase involved in cell wall biosynthesis